MSSRTRPRSMTTSSTSTRATLQHSRYDLIYKVEFHIVTSNIISKCLLNRNGVVVINYQCICHHNISYYLHAKNRLQAVPWAKWAPSISKTIVVVRSPKLRLPGPWEAIRCTTWGNIRWARVQFSRTLSKWIKLTRMVPPPLAVAPVLPPVLPPQLPPCRVRTRALFYAITQLQQSFNFRK